MYYKQQDINQRQDLSKSTIPDPQGSRYESTRHMDLLCELFKTVHNDEIYFEDKGSALKRKRKKGKKRKNHKSADRG
jgi:hypothetical protein